MTRVKCSSQLNVSVPALIRVCQLRINLGLHWINVVKICYSYRMYAQFVEKNS